MKHKLIALWWTLVLISGMLLVWIGFNVFIEVFFSGKWSVLTLVGLVVYLIIASIVLKGAKFHL